MAKFAKPTDDDDPPAPVERAPAPAPAPSVVVIDNNNNNGVVNDVVKPEEVKPEEEVNLTNIPSVNNDMGQHEK